MEQIGSQEFGIISPKSENKISSNKSEIMSTKNKSDYGTILNKSDLNSKIPNFIKSFTNSMNPSTPSANKLQENLESNPIFMKIFNTNYGKLK